MKTGVKILIIVLSVIVGLLLLAAVLISPIAHSYIEKHSKELTGRVVTMDKLKINIFNGTVFIQNFKALEANDKDEFITFDKLKVNLSLYRLLANELRFTEITLANPKIVVIQNETGFNFSDILEKFSSDEEDTTDSDNGFDIDLRNISLKDGELIYRDLSVNSLFDMKNLQLGIPQIFFSGKKTDVGINLTFGDTGGSLALKLLYAIDKEEYNLSVKLTDFALTPVEPYLKEFYNITSFQGKLNTDLAINGSLKHIMNFVAKGTFKLNNVRATDLEDNELLSLQKLNLDIDKIDYMKNQFYLNEFDISGLKINYDIYKDHNTFTNFFVETKEDTLATKETYASSDTIHEQEMDLKINHFSMSQSEIIYADHTLKKDFVLPVSQIEIQAENLTYTNPFNLKLSALVGKKGELSVNWQGNLEDFENQKFSLSLKNFKLADISPYCIHYTAFPLREGLLTFKSSNIIKNNYINSINVIDIYKCKVDNKLKDIKPEYKIPLKAALYILTDRKGKIKMDLPVKGDINSPTFSYRKIIFKTLANLIVKIVASPIDALVNSLGIEKAIFNDIEMDFNSSDITSEQYAQLNKMAEILKVKPELKLSVRQQLNIEESLKELALFNIKRDYYLSTNPTKNLNNLDLEDFVNIRNIKNNNPAFQSYLNQKATNIAEGDIYAKALSLYDQNSLKEENAIKIALRYKLFSDYFSTQEIPAGTINVLSVIDNAPAQGKIVFSFNVAFSDADAESDGTTVASENQK
jgi:hypothetical protein